MAQVSSASSEGRSIFMSFEESGSITNMSGYHSVSYDCGSGGNTCTTNVTTTPK